MNRVFYLNNTRNFNRFIKEGYEECPFTFKETKDRFKYIKLTSDMYLEYTNDCYDIRNNTFQYKNKAA